MGASACDGLGLSPWPASYSLRCGVCLRQASYRTERPSKWGKRLRPTGSRLVEDAGGGVMWLYSSGHTETRNSHSIRGVFDESVDDEQVSRRIQRTCGATGSRVRAAHCPDCP